VNLWHAALTLARAGGGVLATVAQTRGSTPVPAGTKMLVGPDGRLHGTVGGGCVEADVLAAAAAVRETRRPVLLTHHLNADLAGDLGLSCGGTVEILVEPLLDDPAYLQVLEQAALAERGTVRTAVAWDAGPHKRFEPAVPETRGRATARLTDDRQFVVEYLGAPPRVIVFGAGHVGAAIARAAGVAGFRVVVVDDRSEFADPARFADGTLVLAADAAPALQQIGVTAADAVVIATRGHRHDALILERVATSPAGYVGLLGSRRKKAVITKGLTSVGVPASSLARVHVPIGLAIGAETPEEIAVSVVAELIAWRRGAARQDAPQRSRPTRGEGAP